MHKAKLGRHLGVGRNYHGEFPQLVTTLPMQHLAGAEVRGCADGANQPGQTVSLVIDPPVGGFASSDILVTYPRVNPAGAVSAVEVPDYGRTFAPGHYRLFIQSRPPLAIGAGYFLRLGVVRGGVLVPPGLAATFPIWYLLGASASMPVAGWFDERIYLSEQWVLQLLAYTALTDAQTGVVHVSVSPVHLLDDNSGTL